MVAEIAWSRVQELLDKEEIREVLMRYSRGLDRRDMKLLRSCYHDGATDDHGVFRGDADGFVAWIDGGGRTPDAPSVGMHMLGQMHIDVHGDRATAETYHISFSRAKLPEGASYDIHMAAPDEGAPLEEREMFWRGRYLDLFERRNGEWKIARRWCVVVGTRVEVIREHWKAEGKFHPSFAGPSDTLYTGLGLEHSLQLQPQGRTST